MTNREWLESLSDEELSNYLICKNCIVGDGGYDKCDTKCIKNKILWLQAEHKE